jgi:mRNA-degrading endonuclease YafQ of YafQ-DinJ toxin-antitoxin module
MNYSVLTISPFDRQLKRLLKKYPSIKAEFLSLIENLERNLDLGTSLGNN